MAGWTACWESRGKPDVGVALPASLPDASESSPRARAQIQCRNPNAPIPAICVSESPPARPGIPDKGWIALRNLDWSLALVRRKSFGRSARTEMRARWPRLSMPAILLNFTPVASRAGRDESAGFGLSRETFLLPDCPARSPQSECHGRHLPESSISAGLARVPSCQVSRP